MRNVIENVIDNVIENVIEISMIQIKKGAAFMKINLSNFESSDTSLFDFSIVQRDVGGGKTEKEEIGQGKR